MAPLATQLEDRRLLAGGTLDTDDATTKVRAEVTDRIAHIQARELAQEWVVARLKAAS